MTEYCEECGGRMDRPGLFKCHVEEHPKPTSAQRIVIAIETELNNRRGLGWGTINRETREELRDTLAEIVGDELAFSEFLRSGHGHRRNVSPQ